MHRREFLIASASAIGLGVWPLGAQSRAIQGSDHGLGMPELTERLQNGHAPSGRLFIIGGAEDGDGEMPVLRRFVELAGRQDARIAVVTAANTAPYHEWRSYDRALSDLGVRQRVHIDTASRSDCDDPQRNALIRESDGVLLTGGDQRRLVALIGGTELARSIEHAYRIGGACIAGTSAGAAAMSADMLAGRRISGGIGLLRGAIIDQHFSERRRLARLLAAVAKNPRLIGIGIDENTALIISRGRELEIVGAGSVTIVDGRRLPAPADDVEPDRLIQMPGLQVSRLPRNLSCRWSEHAADAQRQALHELREALPALTQ
jgi:cyanophycinase